MEVPFPRVKASRRGAELGERLRFCFGQIEFGSRWAVETHASFPEAGNGLCGQLLRTALLSEEEVSIGGVARRTWSWQEQFGWSSLGLCQAVNRDEEARLGTKHRSRFQEV